MAVKVMKFALVSMALFSVGYFFGGGQLGVLEFLDRLVWDNPLRNAVHDGVMRLDDNRLVDFYATVRIDFSLGPLSLLLGFLSAVLLRGRFDLVAAFLVLGAVARMWIPVVIELVPRTSRGELFSVAQDFAPHLAWDLALLPACLLGTAVGRFVKLRRAPRCRLKHAALLTVLFALVLMAVSQGLAPLLPFAMGGLILYVSVGLLMQSDSTLENSPSHPRRPSGAGSVAA